MIFGSYKINVNSFDSDIDTVCIVPNFVNRSKHFFGDLIEILKNKTDGVSEIFSI